MECSGGYTLARIEPRTGRLHQIRVHAEWFGHPIAGDKIYGPDETLFLDFIAYGWTERHAALLPLDRHALHASEWQYESEEFSLRFAAPLPVDWQRVIARATAIVNSPQTLQDGGSVN
jgi:23S rRNA pseudouridine1911/1915/1917 synthase